MKSIEKKEIVTKIFYVAMDGTEFTNKEECEKYEKSAIGIVKGRLTDVLKQITGTEECTNIYENFFDGLFDDYINRSKYYIFKPKVKEDIENLIQYFSVINVETTSKIEQRESESDKTFEIRKKLQYYISPSEVELGKKYVVRIDTEDNYFANIYDLEILKNYIEFDL